MLLLVSVSFWLLKGANLGWTKTETTTLALDEITGLEYPVLQAVFIPGIDLLGAAVLVAAAAGGLSWILRRNAQGQK